MRVDLDPARGIPLYLQLANALADVITLDELKPGDLLPSENVLATENQLSRATVIKAFDTLADRGLVTRRQGKGTFVNSRPMERQLPELSGFSEHVHGLGLTPGGSLLSFEAFLPEVPGRPDSAFPGDVPLICIERLRTVGQTAVGLHRTLVPADVAERIGLDERTAARPRFSFYEALRAGGVHLASGDETFRAINCDARDAELLGVDEATALIEVVRNSRDTTGRLVEVVRARYLGSQYRYSITFAPTSPGGHLEHAPSTQNPPGRTGGGLAAGPDRML